MAQTQPPPYGRRVPADPRAATRSSRSFAAVTAGGVSAGRIAATSTGA